MSNFFVDTSALGKRYIAEMGSAWVRSWIRPSAGNVIIVSDLASVEGSSIFARLHRENRISLDHQIRLLTVFLRHFDSEYLVIPINEHVLAHARFYVILYHLRTLDAIQLASAQQPVNTLMEPMTFVTSDQRLLNAARDKGFVVDDPNTHP